MSHKDHQAEVRTDVPVTEVAATLRRCWDSSPDGRSFAVAVRIAGLTLTRGRRGVIALDQAGTPHALPRRLGLKADAVCKKLADLDITSLPDIDDIKAAEGRPSPRRTIIMPKPTFAAAQVRRRKPGPPEPVTPADPAYWTNLGYEVEPIGGVLVVTLSAALKLEDRGDELIFHGTPTPDATAVMVAAAKARGWQGIRFSGGTPEWQRQARLEALRQGFPLSAISLDCEPAAPPVAALPMPEHIRRRLVPEPPKNEPAPEVPVPEPAPPAPAYRP